MNPNKNFFWGDRTNKTDEIALKKIIIEYSDIKIKVNPIPLYSILKPETSSDSPSEKSNGVRLVSATHEINHIKINSGDKYKEMPNQSLHKPNSPIVIEFP